MRDSRLARPSAWCDEISGTTEKFWSPWMRIGPALLFGPAFLAWGKLREPGVLSSEAGISLVGWETWLRGLRAPSLLEQPRERRDLPRATQGSPKELKEAPRTEKAAQREGALSREASCTLWASVFPSVKWKRLTLILINKLGNIHNKTFNSSKSTSQEKVFQPLLFYNMYTRMNTCMYVCPQILIKFLSVTFLCDILWPFFYIKTYHAITVNSCPVFHCPR